jgi:alkylation response protein AidB-like acyl-CoA dehydrogenase
MNFDFSDGQKALRQTARQFLQDRAPLPACRRVLESGEGWDPGLWQETATLGWLGAVVPEQYGGAGLGYLELAVIAEEIGRALAPMPFASSVYLATEAILRGGSPDQRQRFLPRLVSGEVVGTLALAERPGHPDPSDTGTVFERGRLTGTKIAVVDGAIATLGIVSARGEQGPALVVVDLDGRAVRRQAHASIDPTHSSASFVFENAPAEPLAGVSDGWSFLEELLDRAAVLLAFEQVGGATRALELTKEFTLTRYAFGRPVASFQALKHRMVDVYVALELARSNCLWGAWALSGGTTEIDVAACSARISASRAFDLAAAEMLQMHGGIGFTWEHDCHLFYRRAKHDALVLGATYSWGEKLVQRLIRRAAVQSGGVSDPADRRTSNRGARRRQAGKRPPTGDQAAHREAAR